MTQGRLFPNNITPDGVDVQTAIENDDKEFKNLYAQLGNIGAVQLTDTKRQCVLSAHINAAGDYDFLTTSGLSVGIDGSAVPVYLSFANGFNDNGAVDYIGKISELKTNAWPLPANQTCYLYIDRDISTQLISYGYSLLQDLYQKAPPASPTLDQHYYNTTECKMYRWNGSAWEVKQRIFVAKAVTTSSATTVTIFGNGHVTKSLADYGITDAYTKGEVYTKDEINSMPFSFRNKIINGNFDVWQRGTSSSAPTLYSSADRWVTRSASSSGGTVSITRQNFTPGQVEVPGNPKYFFRYSLTNPTGVGYVLQRIEGVQTLAGKTATLSFWAKANSPFTSPFTLVQYFGTSGSAEVDTSLAPFSIGTGWQKYVATFTVPSIAGKTIDVNDYLAIQLFTPSATSVTFDIARVQLEEGSVATPFEQKPLGLELILCKRYYETVGAYLPHGLVDSSTSMIVLPFTVQKRVTPTVTLDNNNIDIPWITQVNPTSTTSDINIVQVKFAYNSSFTGRLAGVSAHADAEL